MIDGHQRDFGGIARSPLLASHRRATRAASVVLTLTAGVDGVGSGAIVYRAIWRDAAAAKLIAAPCLHEGICCSELLVGRRH